MLRFGEGVWWYGTRMVTHAETLLGNHWEEIMLLSNFEDCNTYGVNIEHINEDDPVSDDGIYYWKISGPIENMLKFIYKIVLEQDWNIDKILADPRFNDHIDIYLNKLW